MGQTPPPDVDDLQPSVRIWGIELKLGRELVRPTKWLGYVNVRTNLGTLTCAKRRT